MSPHHVEVDVSSLEAPEPLERIMQAAKQLKRGGYIKAIHRMRPCMLYELLERNGLAHATFEKQRVFIYIWHGDDTPVKEYIDGLIGS
jgi:hypothetical protein